MAKETLRSKIDSALVQHLAKHGHAGRFDDEAEFMSFFGDHWKPNEKTTLLAEYNRGVITGNYSSFLRLLGQADETYDLRKDGSFDSVLTEHKISIPGFPKDPDYTTSARKMRGLDGISRRIKAGEFKKFGPVTSLLCAANYTERLYSKTEPHRAYLGRVHKLAVKGSFVEPNKAIEKEEMKLDPKIESLLQSTFGYGQTFERAAGHSGSFSTKVVLQTMRGVGARTPKIEGKPEDYRFNVNSIDNLTYTNNGLVALEEVANQTMSQILLPNIRKLITGTSKAKSLLDVAPQDVETVESLICLHSGDTIQSVSERVGSFANVLKSFNKLNKPDGTPLSDIEQANVLDSLLSSCALTGAFAASSMDEFLYRATQAATLPDFVSALQKAGAYNETPCVDKNGQPAIRGLLFQDGNAHPVDLTPEEAAGTTPITEKRRAEIATSLKEGIEAQAAIDPRKQGNFISSIGNVTVNDIAVSNSVALTLHGLHEQEIEKSRIVPFDAETTSANLTAGQRKAVSNFSLDLFRATDHFKARKAATMAEIQKYCGYLFQDGASPFADASRKVVVKQDSAPAEEADTNPGLHVPGRVDEHIGEEIGAGGLRANAERTVVVEEGATDDATLDNAVNSTSAVSQNAKAATPPADLGQDQGGQ